MRCISVALLGIISLTAGPAGATFIDREMDSLDTEALYDSEYFLRPHSFDFEAEASLGASRTRMSGKKSSRK